MVSSSNRREQSRREVQWDAECRLGGSFSEGSIRDISRGGVFFTPAGQHHGLPERFDVGGMSFVEPGDTVLLKYVPRNEAEAVTVLATVCWVGKSAEHQASGVGLAFDDLE